jgi:hypothetical protein
VSEAIVIRTQSPILAWGLRKFGRMQVRAVYSTPIMPFLGAVLYSKCWVLVASTHASAPIAHL